MDASGEESNVRRSTRPGRAGNCFLDDKAKPRRRRRPRSAVLPPAVGATRAGCAPRRRWAGPRTWRSGPITDMPDARAASTISMRTSARRCRTPRACCWHGTYLSGAETRWSRRTLEPIQMRRHSPWAFRVPRFGRSLVQGFARWPFSTSGPSLILQSCMGWAPRPSPCCRRPGKPAGRRRGLPAADGSTVPQDLRPQRGRADVSCAVR